MKAVKVNALPGYKLQVTFDDGISGVIDLNELVKIGIFSPLQNQELFSKAFTTGYSIAWSEELEIDAVAIYAEIVNKNPEDILSDTLVYAAN